MLPQFKIVLGIVFFFTLYLLIYGILSSFDVTINILNIIRTNSVLSLSYWGGLLLGMSLPFFILLGLFVSMAKKDNKEDTGSVDISNDPNGQPITKESKGGIDYVLILLFMFVIYGLIAVLFIIPEGIVSNNILHSFFAYSIFILITVLLYIFYLSIPTFDGTAKNKIMHFFVHKDSEDVNFIRNDAFSNFRKAFIGMILFIFILGILFFKYISKPRVESTFANIGVGFLSAFGILLMPVVWMFNTMFAVNYFLFYPVVLMGIRFFRSIGMSYLHYSYLDKNRSELTRDFIEQLEHINDYSPSWNLIGLGPIKAILNMNGFGNEFSKTFIDTRNTQKNLAQDKYIFSGMFRMFMQNNNKNIVINVIIFILTIVFSAIFLGNVIRMKNS
jgi:hypothetical protein